MHKALALVALVMSTTPAAAEPFHHLFGEWREYNRDWLAACPDAIVEDAADYYGYSCFASTGSQELNDANLPAYKLTLIRNRLDGVVDLAITIAPTDGSYDAERPMVLQFGGDPADELALGRDIETRHNTTNQFFLIGPKRDEILARMEERNAVTLSVPLVGREEPVVTRLSLRGVLASLDFMLAFARRVSQY
jgi:hypothetical protein